MIGTLVPHGVHVQCTKNLQGLSTTYKKHRALRPLC